MTLGAMPPSSTVFEGRLLGHDPASFHFLFGYWSQDTSGLYRSRYFLYDSNELTRSSWHDYGLASVAGEVDRSPRPFLGHVDSDRLVARIPGKGALWMFDGNDVRMSASTAEELGVLTLPSVSFFTPTRRESSRRSPTWARPAKTPSRCARPALRPSRARRSGRSTTCAV